MPTNSAFTTEELELPGVLLITPKLFEDMRGFSVLTYSIEQFRSLNVLNEFIQDFTSLSKKDVLRGLHYQRAPFAQDKLVRCTKGEIFDVAADCDPTSPTYGKHVSVNLKGDTQTILYIPGKYAHGYCVLSPEAIVEYKLSDTYHPEAVGGALFNDPLLNIPWPINDPILSEQDTKWPQLKA